MSARPCAVCDGSKNSGIHSRFHAEFHPYQDATRPGLKPMREGVRAYMQSDEHKEAYGVAEAYCVGHALDAPGKCFGPLTPHHTLKQSYAGKEYSEKHYPVVTMCAWLNDAIESDPEVRAWALTARFTRGDESYPFLVSKQEAARNG